MSDKLRIALLCNNKMAMPAMMRMVQAGVLCAVATADKDMEAAEMFRQQAGQSKIPYLKTNIKTYKEQLSQWLADLQPDVVFVMTYPWRLPISLLSTPRLGFLNFHYGLLPEMRGADPIFESVRHGMAVAGVTVHVMDEGLDTGPVVLREELPVNPEFSYGMLSKELALMGDRMCGKLLQSGEREAESRDESGERRVESGDTWNGWPLTVQDESKARYWPKVRAEEVMINWKAMDSNAITAAVRAFNPIGKGVPAAINGWIIGITDVSDVNLQGATPDILPGTIVCLDFQNGLIVYCKDGLGLKLDVVYTGEGIFPGYKLGFFGVAQGMVFS